VFRPSQKYREHTDSEWDEFLGRLAQRELELGTCGRVYGTGCQHERIQNMIDNLEERIAKAT
jgi:hypothetical protein